MTPDHPSDPAPRTLRLPSGPAALVDEGEGTVLLALHGLPGSHRDFRWLAPVLTPHLRVIRPDLPGFGGTPPGAVRLADRVAWVRELVMALGVERPFVLGHSFGGPLATAYAVAHPVAGLALLGSAGLRRHRSMRLFGGTERAISRALRTPLRRALGPALRRAYLAAGFPSSIAEPDVVRTLHVIAGTPLPLHAANVHRLAVPTLVAWCEDDPLVEPAVSEELAAACPPGPRLAFAEGGHNLQKTCAVEIGASLARWISP